MVTKVYLIRHCEAQGNVEMFFQGQYDGTVTERGYRQLEKLKEKFRNIPFDAFYTSPLIRAKETARYASFYAKAPIFEDKGLMEINGGECEGKLWKDIGTLFPEEAKVWDTEIYNFQAPGGESFRDVQKRMVDSVLSIVGDNSGKTIGIVSHGGAIKTLMCYISGLPIERMNEVKWYDNTSVTVLDFYDNGMIKLISENDTSHIRDDDDTKPFEMWWAEENASHNT